MSAQGDVGVSYANQKGLKRQQGLEEILRENPSLQFDLASCVPGKVKTGVPWGGRGAGPCRCLGHPAAGHGGTRCPTLCCKAGDVYLSSSETHW